MDYSKFQESTLVKMSSGAPLDYTTLTDDELEELSKSGRTTLNEEEVSKLESFARGIGQGVTLGFGDEIVGGVESLFTDKTYQQARDEARQANLRAEEANPLTYLGGNLVGGVAVPLPGGSLVSGSRAVAQGAKALSSFDKAARLAKIGAGAGAAASLGSSNIDAVEAIKDQDTQRLLDLAGDTAQGAVGGAVMAPFLAQAVPGAAKGVGGWWKSMRFGRDISDTVDYSLKNPKFMSMDNLQVVSDDLDRLTRQELLPMVSDDLQKAATSAYDVAKKQATSKVELKDLVDDIKSAYNHVNPSVSTDPAFIKSKDRAVSMLQNLAELSPASKTGGKPALDVDDVYKLREEIQTMIDIADPNKASGNRDAFNSALKLKSALDKRLQAAGVPVDDLAAQYSSVSDVVGQTGVDLRNVDVSKLPLREREAAEKLKKLLVRSKKTSSSDEARRIQEAQKLLKESGLVDPAKVDDVFARGDDLAKQDYLLRSAMDESFLATDPKGYATGFGALTARGKALQFTGQAAGAVGSAKEGVAKLGRAIYSATPEQLIQMANGISNTKIASMLRNVASQPEKKRKALLFTMIQNPAYREAIGALDPE